MYDSGHWNKYAVDEKIFNSLYSNERPYRRSSLLPPVQSKFGTASLRRLSEPLLISDSDIKYADTRKEQTYWHWDRVGSEKTLAAYIPESTTEERWRFLKARRGDVNKTMELLEKYIRWRFKYASRYRHQDPWILRSTSNLVSEDVEFSMSSSTLCSSPSFSSLSAKKSAITHVPQIMYMNNEGSPPLARDATRICHVIPGLYDPNLTSIEDYAMRCALYLDSKLRRDTMEKVTVLVDIRSGVGWSNPSPRKLFPLLKRVSKVMNDCFPERLATCIVHPVPRSALALWKIAKCFIDPATVSKIVLISGKTDAGGQPPLELLKYLDKHAITHVEKHRKSLFM